MRDVAALAPGEDFGERLREVARQVNEKHRVDLLCNELPSRLEELVTLEGDRLRK